MRINSKTEDPEGSHANQAAARRLAPPREQRSVLACGPRAGLGLGLALASTCRAGPTFAAGCLP